MLSTRFFLAATALLGALALAGPAQASDGVWSRAFGRNVSSVSPFDVCTLAADCLAGTRASRGGDLNLPEGVGTDAAGNIWVADTGNQRIEKFDAAGTFLLAVGKSVSSAATQAVDRCATAAECQAGAPGTKGGEFSGPRGVAVDAAGNVYVTDAGNARVQQFDRSGSFIRAFGRDVLAGGGQGFETCDTAANCQAGTDAGTGGALSLPQGIAIDAVGNIFVADAGNNRIQAFDAANHWLLAFGKDVDAAQPATGFEVCAVEASCKTARQGGLGGEFTFPIGVATDPGGNLHVSESTGGRIQTFDSSLTFVRAFGKDVDATTPGTGFEICTVAASCQIGKQGDRGGELIAPTGIATDRVGDVYVNDQLNSRVQKFDASGGFVRAFGKDVDASRPGVGFEICTASASCQAGAKGGLGGELSEPDLGIVADAAGDLYVADRDNHRIQEFSDTPPTTTPPANVPSAPPPASTSDTGSSPGVEPPAVGPEGAPPARVPPNVARLTQSHARWRAARRAASGAKKGPVGTTFSFVLDQDARVSLAFTRKVGRRKVAVGTLPVAGRNGPNTVRFRGRVSRSRTLKPGRYTVAITATNDAGRSAARSLRFTVLGG